jgi:hypothetical protein
LTAWRTGANETQLSFSDDVIIGGKTLKKRKYALFTIQTFKVGKLFFIQLLIIGTPEELGKCCKNYCVNEESTPKATDTFTIGINGLDSIMLS